MSLAQQVYGECCHARHVKVNSQIMMQLAHAAAPTITDIDASLTFLGAQGLHALLDFIEIHRGVRSLNIAKNGVDATVVQHLCDVLSQPHPSLHVVSVNDNLISIPSIRALADLCKSCPRITSISMEGCHVPEEWDRRIKRSTDLNRAYRVDGFIDRTYRVADEWLNVFVAVLAPAKFMTLLTTQAVQIVSSLASASHVRVTPIVIAETDSPEAIAWKISLCRDSNNYSLPRVIMALTNENYDSPCVQHTLAACQQYAFPVVPPLKNKLGQQRGKVVEPAAFLFVYHMDYVACLEHEWDSHRFGARELTEQDLQHRAQYEDAAQRLRASVLAGRLNSDDDSRNDLASFYTFHTTNQLLLRAQTDLHVSFSGLLRVTFHGFPSIAATDAETGVTSVLDIGLADAAELARNYELLNMISATAKYHQADLKDVWTYITSPAASRGFPLILYGGEGIGKRAVAAACALRLLHRDVCDSSKMHRVPWRGEVLESEPLLPRLHRVVPIVCGHQTTTSPVLMCYTLLAIFQPELTNAFFPTLDRLAEATKAAMQQYDGPSDVTLFLIGLDKVDQACRREFNVLSCLASSLSVRVRVVITLATESPLLVGFRNLQPQPYEILVRRAPVVAQLHVVTSHMAACKARRIGQHVSSSESTVAIHLPGLAPEDITEAAISVAMASALPSAAKVILQKEDAESHAFCELVGLMLSYVVGELTTVEAVVQFLQHQVPNTLPKLLDQLILLYAQRANLDARSLRTILTALAISPLPMTEVVTVCEQHLAACREFESSSTASNVEQGTNASSSMMAALVLQLLEDEILRCHRDGIVHLANPALVSAVREGRTAGEDEERSYAFMASLVAVHMRRLVVTFSPEMTFCVRRCVALLLDSQQLELAEALVLDPSIVEKVLDTRGLQSPAPSDNEATDATVEAQNEAVGGSATIYFLIDALYRLINTQDMMLELLINRSYQFRRCDKRREYQMALFVLQCRCPETTAGIASLCSRASSLMPYSHSYFAQNCVLGSRDNPYRQRAVAFTHGFRVSPQLVSHPLILPRNDVCSGQMCIISCALHAPSEPLDASVCFDSSSGSSNPIAAKVPVPGTHCHSLDDTLAVTTPNAVFVFKIESRCLVAELKEPFGPSVPLLGALVVAESRIVVIAADQIILWDVSQNSWVLIPDTTTSLSGDSLDATRTMLLCTSTSAPPSEETAAESTESPIVLVDLAKKRIVQSVPYSGLVREAVFAGMHSAILVVSTYDVTLIKDEENRVTMSHHALIRAVSASPDGKFVAVAVDKDVYLWSSRGDLMHYCSKHTAPVNDVSFHPNGSVFLSAAEDGTVKVWKTLTGLVAQDLSMDIPVTEGGDWSEVTPLESTSRHLQPSYPITPAYAQISNDGSRLFARCGQYVRQWDAVTYLSAGAVRTSGGGIVHFMSITGSYVAAVTSQGHLNVWSTRAAFPSPLIASQNSVTSNLYTGTRVAASSSGSHVPIVTMKLAPSGDLLITRDASEEVTVWNLQTGQLQARLNGIDAFVALDASTMFTVEKKSKISVFSFATNEVVGSYALPRDIPVMTDSAGQRIAGHGFDLNFSDDHENLFVIVNAGTGTRIYVYDLPSFRLSNVFLGHFDTVLTCDKILPDLLVTASADGTVRLWSLSNHAERSMYRHHVPIMSAVEPHRRAPVPLHSATSGADAAGPTPLQSVAVSNTPVQLQLSAAALVFIDAEGSVFEVMVSNPASCQTARVEAFRKSIRRGSDRSSSRTSSSAIEPHLEVADMGKRDVAAEASSSTAPKLRFASRLEGSHLLLVADDTGALLILNPREGQVMNVIPSAGCSCAPVSAILGKAPLNHDRPPSSQVSTRAPSQPVVVLVGCHTGDIRMFDVAFPDNA